jgi:glycosyltransferase involved in cell wall biosynthesis
MPAYNAARTLERTYRDIPAAVVDDILVVDDVSRDETVATAARLGLSVLVNLQNKGYGGNLKTCFVEALRRGADVIVLLHPDYQYDATRIPALIEPILRGDADIVLGSRFLSSNGPLGGGMAWWRYLANRALTGVENMAYRQRLSECHTGFRAYSRTFLLTVPFLLNSNDFAFDAEILAQAVHFSFRIAEIEVPTRYFAESSSISFRRALRYGCQTLGVVARYLLQRARLRRDRIFSCELLQVVSPLHREALLDPAGSVSAAHGSVAENIRLQ